MKDQLLFWLIIIFMLCIIPVAIWFQQGQKDCVETRNKEGNSPISTKAEKGN